MGERNGRCRPCPGTATADSGRTGVHRLRDLSDHGRHRDDLGAGGNPDRARDGRIGGGGRVRLRREPRHLSPATSSPVAARGPRPASDAPAVAVLCYPPVSTSGRILSAPASVLQGPSHRSCSSGRLCSRLAAGGASAYGTADPHRRLWPVARRGAACGSRRAWRGDCHHRRQPARRIPVGMADDARSNRPLGDGAPLRALDHRVLLRPLASGMTETLPVWPFQKGGVPPPRSQVDPTDTTRTGRTGRPVGIGVLSLDAG